MPSRTELKAKIVELEKKLKAAEVQAAAHKIDANRIEEKFAGVEKQWQIFQKEYVRLSDVYNSAQGYARPTKFDVVRHEARGEIVRTLLDLLLGPRNQDTFRRGNWADK